MGRKAMTETPKQHQYVIEQAATRRITDIAKELGVSRQRIDQILKKHGIWLRQDQERRVRFLEANEVERQARKAERPKYERPRPWFYPIIRKIAAEVNQEGIHIVCKRHGINPYHLKLVFIAAGFEVNGNHGYGNTGLHTQVTMPSEKTSVELEMEQGLGPHIKYYTYDPDRHNWRKRKREREARSE